MSGKLNQNVSARIIDPEGEVVFWTSDTGIDGENPVDLDELDLIVIDPAAGPHMA